MIIDRKYLRGVSLRDTSIPRIYLRGEAGGAPISFEGYPLELDLPNARSMRTYTLFGNTSEDAKGVGDWDGEKFVAPIRVGSRNLWDEEWEMGTFSQTDGSKVANPSLYRSANYIPVKANAVLGIKKDTTAATRIFYYKADKTFINSVFTSATFTTVTTPADCAFVNFAYAYNDGRQNVCINYSDDKDGEYSPYFAPTLYPSVLSSPLHKIGDIVDYKESNGKEWHGLGVYKFTGEEDFTLYSNNRVFTRILSSSIDYSQGYSTIVLTSLGYRSGVNPYSYDKSVGIEGTGGAVFFRDDDHSTSVEDWRTYLRGLYANGTPLTLVYPLATPTEVQGEPLPRLAIPRGTSIVTLDTEVEPSNITAKI